MVGLLLGAIGAAFGTGGLDGLLEGTRASNALLWRALPYMVLGITLAGMLQVLVPPRTIARWMGDEAGITGLAIGVLAGMITPGGPYVMYPVAAALMNSGAGIGALGGFANSRHALPMQRLLIWEIPFLGVPFALARYSVAIAMPVITIVLVPMIYRLMPASARGARRTRPTVDGSRDRS
jgi:uncharacterized membrane protein YraQ (UPF0718 family)